MKAIKSLVVVGMMCVSVTFISAFAQEVLSSETSPFQVVSETLNSTK
jgi:hypothetical protein